MKKVYSVIPRTLSIIVNRSHDKVLLLLGNPRKTHWANRYNAVGGHIEAGEEVYRSAAREIAEESGIALSPQELRFKGLVHVRTYFNENVFMLVFRADVGRVTLRASHEGTLHWISIAKISELENIAPDLKQLIPKILGLRRGEFLSGWSAYNKQRRLTSFVVKIFDV
ncbi:NUDIX domain-containing protein [Patescibacteria group bacterium]|nr:NUDIX domain-containing protein [Patescibacteria group bacterium]MCL5010416.1 NUDIX domain-containing protein [Patescibacteria group bacterium]